MNRPTYYKSFRSRNFQGHDTSSVCLKNVIDDTDNIILDIGFGTGESTISLKKVFSSHTVCGIECYKPGIKNLIAKDIPTEYGDAAKILEKFRENTFRQIYMLFPDPWQKKKHRKRRLFNEYVFNKIHRILKKDGLFHFASDNINYAFEARDIIQKVTSCKIEFSKHRGLRPITKYEIKGMKKRNFIFDLIYSKK